MQIRIIHNYMIIQSDIIFNFRLGHWITLGINSMLIGRDQLIHIFSGYLLPHQRFVEQHVVILSVTYDGRKFAC